MEFKIEKILNGWTITFTKHYSDSTMCFTRYFDTISGMGKWMEEKIAQYTPKT